MIFSKLTIIAIKPTTNSYNSKILHTNIQTKHILVRSTQMWFKHVFGFQEPKQYEDVRALFEIESSSPSTDSIVLRTKDGSRSFYVGTFETPSVSELRVKVQQQKNATIIQTTATGLPGPGLTFHHISGDVGVLHRDPTNSAAVFQAASQFNCLEMASPSVTPEDGVSCYEFDHTQGPTCALACPAATVYRNYFVNEHGQGGGGVQLDLLKDTGRILGNTASDDEKGKYWTMQNGYALPVGMGSIHALREKMVSGEVDVDKARDVLRVGVHWDTEVDVLDTPGECGTSHNVTQVFCSALPIGYHDSPANDWSEFAQLVLDGVYEATLAVGAIKATAHAGQQRVSVYLTMVGGGVFQNRLEWIAQAIDRALRLYEDQPIDVFLVHYGRKDDLFLERLPEID